MRVTNYLYLALIIGILVVSGCVSQISLPSDNDSYPVTLPQANITDQQKCGDNFCNSIEKQTGGCPQDCVQKTESNTPVAERWIFGGYAIGLNAGNEEGSVFMPDVISLENGTYRIYY